MELQLAQKAVLYDDGKILMVRKSPDDPFNPLKWEIPGGRLKIGESLDEHLRREVKEEVGLDIEIGPPLAMWQWSMGEGTAAKTVVAVARLCQPLSHDVSFDGHDEGDFLEAWQWVPIFRVSAMDLIPNSRAAILEALDNLRRYLTS